jgi:aryl-alcohol dehydrogenase-like predicted oxidoreductase
VIDYQLLGRTGLRVADICLGTMTFGEAWGWGAPKEEARKIYDRYRELGGNFIDTVAARSCSPPSTPTPRPAKTRTPEATIASR